MTAHLENVRKALGSQKKWHLMSFIELFHRHSSIGLGFWNLTSQLRQANVIGFCMQLGNSEVTTWVRERYKGEGREMGNTAVNYPHCFLTAYKTQWRLCVLARTSDSKTQTHTTPIFSRNNNHFQSHVHWVSEYRTSPLSNCEIMSG